MGNFWEAHRPATAACRDNGVFFARPSAAHTRTHTPLQTRLLTLYSLKSRTRSTRTPVRRGARACRVPLAWVGAPRLPLRTTLLHCPPPFPNDDGQ
jgi:hypothetical protein